MKDIVYISRLRVNTKIGVFAWEKKIERPLLLDLEMSSNVAKAAISDDISEALNYDAISQFISNFAHTNHFNLIETFAERLSEQLILNFGIGKLKLKLGKPGAVAAAEEVGVIIERHALKQ